MRTLDEMAERARHGFVPPGFLKGSMDPDDIASVLAFIYNQAGWFTRFVAVGNQDPPGTPVSYKHVFVEVFHPKDGHWYMLDPLFPSNGYTKGMARFVKNVFLGLAPVGEVPLHPMIPEKPSAEPPKAPDLPAPHKKHKLSEFSNVPGGGVESAIYQLIHMTKLSEQIEDLRYQLNPKANPNIANRDRVEGLLNLLEKIEKDLRERQCVSLERPHRKDDPWNKEK
jgi:hypothetical protein